MSLFGYREKTTPRLEAHAQKDPNFVYKTAWAAAVNTLISLPMIYNIQYHSPYELNYAGDDGNYNFNGAEKTRLNNYNNAMLFEDMILDKLLRFAAQSKNETYFYYLSDHGEALGQDGLWGHGHLNPADLQVPFFVYDV